MSEYKLATLSVRQPWAWLLAEGLKQYETRSWKTKHRGVIAIHAAKGFGDMELDAIHSNQELAHTLYEYKIHKGNIYSKLAFGCVIGLAELVDIFPTGKIAVSEREGCFGDFSAGRYAWLLRNVVKFKEPIALMGKQGLFTWYLNDAVVNEVRKARARMGGA